MKTLPKPRRSAANRIVRRPARILAVLLCSMIGIVTPLGALSAQDVKNTIMIENFTFSPPELNVAAGTTVTWINHDDIPHSIVDKEKIFRSKAFDTDGTYSFTFISAGSFDYFCGLHPHMTGKIVVTP